VEMLQELLPKITENIGWILLSVFVGIFFLGDLTKKFKKGRSALIVISLLIGALGVCGSIFFNDKQDLVMKKYIQETVDSSTKSLTAQIQVLYKENKNKDIAKPILKASTPKIPEGPTN
jgi:hypothetical protein